MTDSYPGTDFNSAQREMLTSVNYDQRASLSRSSHHRGVADFEGSQIRTGLVEFWRARKDETGHWQIEVAL